MDVLIVTPVAAGSTRGNGVTARRWAAMLGKLGCHLVLDGLAGSYDPLNTLLQQLVYPTLCRTSVEEQEANKEQKIVPPFGKDPIFLLLHPLPHTG